VTEEQKNALFSVVSTTESRLTFRAELLPEDVVLDNSDKLLLVNILELLIRVDRHLNNMTNSHQNLRRALSLQFSAEQSRGLKFALLLDELTLQLLDDHRLDEVLNIIHFSLASKLNLIPELQQHAGLFKLF
jgi:hypothetical protein